MIDNNKGWTISNNSPGKECVRFDMKVKGTASYTSKPTRRNDTPYCIAGSNDGDDEDTLNGPALEADNWETKLLRGN